MCFFLRVHHTAFEVIFLYFFTGMVKAIKEFCNDNETDVNMRVGVHSGRVMCGIVGSKRFKVKL